MMFKHISKLIGIVTIMNSKKNDNDEHYVIFLICFKFDVIFREISEIRKN